MGVSLRAQTVGDVPITAEEHDESWQLLAGAPSAKTLATGAITADVAGTAPGSGAGKYIMTSESGVNDTLDNVFGTQPGDRVVLMAAAGHTILVPHNTGNIRMQGGIPMSQSPSEGI